MLGLRARDQDVGRYGEVVVVEGAPAGQVRDRHPFRRVRDLRREAGRLIGGQKPLRVGYQDGPIHAQHAGQQHRGFKLRRLRHGPQRPPGLFQRRANRPPGH